MDQEITIKLNKEEANKLSIIINNMFIEDFWDIELRLETMYDEESLRKLQDTMIYLKSQIDIKL